jgi:myo-inositol-1(or 4)-monophosphatase
MSKFGKTRMLGSASQSLLQVAKGSVECYSEKDIMLWDVAAGIALVEGAGGNVSITAEKGRESINVVASNGIV